MTHVHHAIDYVELTVTDLARAKGFWSAALGWEFTDYGPAYAAIRWTSGEGEVGGLTVGTPIAAGSGGVFVLLYSDDLDTTAAAVESAGGLVVEGPYDFPGGRRFAFTDPDGNRLGVWSEAPEA